MREVTIIVLVLFVLVGCTSISMKNLTPEERNYFEKVDAFPLEFTMPTIEADDAWGRAQSFIGRFSSMKLQTVTDYVIQTYNPGSSDVKFGYYVTKTPMDDEFQINVQCNTGNMFAGGDAKRNARILAYYIKTGELCNPRFIAR